jgi:hypothetical protein
MNNENKKMTERQKAFFKELKELLAKHNAEFDTEDRGREWQSDRVTVVYFKGNEENKWNFETADLHPNV